MSVATLVKSELFWGHVELCGVLLSAMKDTIKRSDKKEQMRVKVKVLMTEFISIPVSLYSLNGCSSVTATLYCYIILVL